MRSSRCSELVELGDDRADAADRLVDEPAVAGVERADHVRLVGHERRRHGHPRGGDQLQLVGLGHVGPHGARAVDDQAGGVVEPLQEGAVELLGARAREVVPRGRQHERAGVDGRDRAELELHAAGAQPSVDAVGSDVEHELVLVQPRLVDHEVRDVAGRGALDGEGQRAVVQAPEEDDHGRPRDRTLEQAGHRVDRAPVEQGRHRVDVGEAQLRSPRGEAQLQQRVPGPAGELHAPARSDAGSSPWTRSPATSTSTNGGTTASPASTG